MKTSISKLAATCTSTLFLVKPTSAFIACNVQSFSLCQKQPLYAFPKLSFNFFRGEDQKNNFDNKTIETKTSLPNSDDFVIHANHDQSDEIVMTTTIRWIQKTVIGLNLCPFADRPFKTKELSFYIVRGNHPPSIAEVVTEQLLLKRDQRGTAIIICPDFYPDDFEEYMIMIQYLEQRIMTYFELHDDVQIAPFHPKFTFEGSGNSIESYTNRSPYPMFHVLRTDEVERAVNKFLGGNPGKVWRRNKRLLTILEGKLGRLDVVNFLFDRIKVNENMDKIIHESLEQTKDEMDRETEDEKIKFRGPWVR